ncbi:Hsp20/alpha crystallin family protein [Dysgonomonas alginatilytica]|nr:Hsp20/alpha crystallin family protein [Dysgonomonas alginatilytica]
MNNRLMKFDSRKSFLPLIFNDDFFTNFFEGSGLPAANVVENKDEFRVELSVPGFNKDDFNVEVEKNVLIISAKQENKQEEKDKEEKLIRQEFRSSSFSRSFVLPENVDMEQISAQYKDGVLKLSIPKLNKTPEDKIKRIEIE